MNAPGELPLFKADEITLLRDGEFASSLRRVLLGARVSICATQFVTDLRSHKDRDREVLLLGHAFAQARWRGVSTRVILPVYPLPGIDVDGNYPFSAFLHHRGVAVRRAPQSRALKSPHAKMVIVDDEWVIVGSHNWTPTSFQDNRELSIVVRSRDVAEQCSLVFERHWTTAREFEP
jgi:phosphatidylserine/phosphatidylglycerophosphate/cardiolipin synthase-like enzyme